MFVSEQYSLCSLKRRFKICSELFGIIFIRFIIIYSNAIFIISFCFDCDAKIKTFFKPANIFLIYFIDNQIVTFEI